MTAGTSLVRQYACSFETPFPPNSPWLNGAISIATSEVDVDPDEVVFGPETYSIDVNWTLGGSLSHLICGQWCVCVDLDCFGAGEYEDDFQKCQTFYFDCKDHGKFSRHFDIRVKDVKGGDDRCTLVCKIIVTVSLLDCEGHPSRVAGFCEGPLVQFSPATN